MIVLVLESSTSSAKAMVFNSKTLSLTKKTSRFSSKTSKNPEKILQETLRLGRAASSSLAVDAIALGSTWHSLML